MPTNRYCLVGFTHKRAVGIGCGNNVKGLEDAQNLGDTVFGFRAPTAEQIEKMEAEAKKAITEVLSMGGGEDLTAKKRRKVG